ncbi:hypothetical protein E4U31_001801 [Claviceps sp. LM219 group G6]|nr:hypothetical protein E4U31_001801 [Claviceps sp. LM219 group G6]
MPAVSNVPPSSSVLRTPTVERPKRAIDNVQSPQTARTPSRHSRGPPHAESAAVRPRPRTPARPAFKSNFIARDNGRLLFYPPGPRPGESSSQEAARKERDQIQRRHRVVRRDCDAQPPSLTPTASAIYARDHPMTASPMLRQSDANGNQFAASPTLRQSGSPAPDDVEPTFAPPRHLDDVFEPTSAQPRIYCALCPV